MQVLCVGLCALLVGPIFVGRLRHDSLTAYAIDAFVMVAIGGVVLGHMLPECVAVAGWPVLGAVWAGAMLPTLLHAPLHAARGLRPARGTQPLIALAALAMGVHALLDGVAMAPATLGPAVASEAATRGAAPATTGTLLVAVVLHRLLDGTAAWYLLRPHWGRRLAFAALLGLAFATLLGFWAAGHARPLAGGVAMAWVQAGVAGSLLHVVAHHAPKVATPWPRWASALGCACAAGVLWVMAIVERGDVVAPATAATDWLGPLQTVAAPLLLALVAMACLHAACPHQPLHGASHRSADGGFGPGASPCRLGWLAAWRQAWPGAWRGLWTDTPVAQTIRLFDEATAADAVSGATGQGVGARGRHDGVLFGASAYAPAFLSCASSFGATTALTSLACHGLAFTLTRGAALWLWGSASAIVLGARAGSGFHAGTAGARCQEARPIRRGRIVDGIDFAFGEGLDALAPWLMFGLFLAGLIGDSMARCTLSAAARGGWDVPMLLLLALPIYLHPVAATLVGSVLLGKGASVGAVMAFELCSAATSLVAARLWGRIFGAAATLTSLLGLALVAWAAGGVANVIGLGAAPAMPFVAWPPPHPGVVARPAAVLILSLCALSWLRQGIRPFLAPILAWRMHWGRHHHH